MAAAAMESATKAAAARATEALAAIRAVVPKVADPEVAPRAATMAAAVVWAAQRLLHMSSGTIGSSTAGHQ